MQKRNFKKYFKKKKESALIMRKQTKLVAVLSTAALLAIGASMTSFAAQGWAEEDGTWVYYDKNGDRVTDSWKKSGDNWFWLDDSGENYIAFAERMESYGVKNIIFTDIDKDGMLAGPNFDQLAALRASVSCEIIASGGVSTLEDIAALKKLGIDGAIAGKAVYTGTLDLAKAIKEAE